MKNTLYRKVRCNRCGKKLEVKELNYVEAKNGKGFDVACPYCRSTNINFNVAP